MQPEVVVVGAGPAGSSAAYHLARYGRRVLLIDRACFPRDKSCGDGLTRSAVRLLAHMGILGRFRGAQKIVGARVFMRGKGSRDFLYPSGLSDPDYGLVVPRHRLDHALCEHAVMAGAQLWENARVKKLIRDNGQNGLEVLHLGRPTRLYAPVIVAADGAASRLAFQANLAHGAEGLGFAIRGYYSGIDGLGDLLEIYMPLTDPSDRYILPSYGWVFPTGPSTANIGVGIFEQGHDASVRALMERFIGDLRFRDPRFRSMAPAGTWRGAPLNFAFQPERCAAAGLVLVGDAAGLVSPFTGEGISYAIESGRLAAESIHRNLRSDTEVPDLHDYVWMLEKRYMGYFEAGRQSARRYLLLWHVLESTFHNDKPLFALCRKAALFPEGIGETSPSGLLDDVGPLIDCGGLRVREDLLAVGEMLLDAVRQDWPFLARLSVSGQGDPGVPFRPALLVLLAAAVQPQPKPPEPLLWAAAAVELGYMASLAHLSVDNGDAAGGPSLDDDHLANWGNMLAVMMGDFLLSKAYELSARASAQVSLSIADALSRVCEGRLRERSHAFRLDISDEECLGVLTLKMATLFDLPCRLGAMLSGLSPHQINALSEYGRNLGLAFTLTDQVLELDGTASELGKLTASESGEGLYSWPVRQALLRVGTPPPDQPIAPIPVPTGVLEETLSLARHFAHLAEMVLDPLPDGPASCTLRRLANYAVERDVGRRPDLDVLF